MASPRIAQTRKERKDEKVFRATVEVLRTAGTGAVTVEAVFARSGVAKKTICRRSRRSLVRMCWRASGLPSPELKQRPIEACGATCTGPGVTADGVSCEWEERARPARRPSHYQGCEINPVPV